MTSTTYMILNDKNTGGNGRDASRRRSHIERQLNCMEKLFDDSDAESCSSSSSSSSSSGESMANDDADVDFLRDGAKAKVLQLWGGQLGSMTVDATTTQATVAATATETKQMLTAGTKTLNVTTRMTDTTQSLEQRSSSGHGGPGQRPPMVRASSSRIRKSSSADNMIKKTRTSVRGGSSAARNTSSSSRPSTTMNQSFTLDDSLLAKLPTKGIFSSRHGENDLSKSEHGGGQASTSSKSASSSSSRSRIAPTRTPSSSSSTRRCGGELSRSEHVSRNSHSNELSHSSEHGRNRSNLKARKRDSDLSMSQHRKTGLGRRSPPPVRGVSATKSSGIETLHVMRRSTSHSSSSSNNSGSDAGESDGSTKELKVRHSTRPFTTKQTGPRRIKSSCGDIDRMSSSLSRKELISSSLDAATTTLSSNNKNAQWDSNASRPTKKPDAVVDRRKLLSRTMSLTTRKRGGDLSSSSDHGKNGSRRHLICPSTTKQTGPRRVKSSCGDIDRMSSSLSRRELISSSLDAAATIASNNNKNAQWDSTSQTMKNPDVLVDRRKLLSRTMSLTTRKRGGDLSSSSDHGKNGSRRHLIRRGGDLSSSSDHGTNGSRYRTNSRISSRRSGGVAGGLSRGGVVTNHHSGDENTEIDSSSSPIQQMQGTTQIMGASFRGAPRRVKSSSDQIGLMGRVSQKTSPARHGLESQDSTLSSSSTTKNERWETKWEPQPGTTKMISDVASGGGDGVVSSGSGAPLPGYYDMKQKYQQSWDAASCLVAVNNERTKYSLRSLTRDKDLDIEAQKHAEAIAQSNGNYVLKINYMGHVLRGKSVNKMHKTAIQSNSPTTTNAKTNILNPDFNAMGVGVATDINGVVYVCEIFHGRFTLSCCTDEPSK